MTTQLNPPIGLFGGTFNPIHWGHIRPCQQIMSQLQLSQVNLLPCHKPPHKETPGVNAEQRAHMVGLACEQLSQPHCRFELDLTELQRDTPSYTLLTLEHFKRQHPNSPICFLMGMDSLLSFKSWYKWQQILQLCHLVVSCRPGYQLAVKAEIYELLQQRQTTHAMDLHNQMAGLIYLADVTPQDISSTQIRQAIAQGKAIDQLLPSSVAQYIQQQHIYQE